MADVSSLLTLEKKYGFDDGALIAGVDEVGRGPLCGSVVAAALCFSQTDFDPTLWSEINDSKKLSLIKREKIFLKLSEAALAGTVFVGVGEASVQEIDELNILQATFLAMTRAVDALSITPQHVLIDGNNIPPALTYPAEAIVKGDQKSLSIAAASIVAKVTRDREMACLSVEHPQYGWEKNAGYGTKAHLAALTEFGITKHHRRSFAPIKNMI
ncbi:MAG: ribonuclease HII [Alphaproteobacteria bacterium]